MKSIEERFEGQEKIPIPPFWGGLRIVPTIIEFWVYIAFSLSTIIPMTFSPTALVHQGNIRGMWNTPHLRHIHGVSYMSFDG